MTPDEAAVSETIKLLLQAGGIGILLGLVIAVVYGVLKIYGPLIKLPKPVDPGPPPTMPDVPEVPRADPWETDPNNPGGGMGGG